MFHWLLVEPQALKSLFSVEYVFLIRKCPHLVVSAHVSLQVLRLTHVCEGEKQSQLLSTTSPRWFWRMAANKTVVHSRNMFLSILRCGTSYFKKWFFITVSKRTCYPYFNKYSLIFSGILASQRTRNPMSLPPMVTSVISGTWRFGLSHFGLWTFRSRHFGLGTFRSRHFCT